VPLRAIIDDRLLVELLLVGLPQRLPDAEFSTTSYWYYRACRAAVAGAGGHLSGPFARLAAEQQSRAILALLQLPDSIALPDPRLIVPAMADVSLRHPRLNLLNLEAVASTRLQSASIWLSVESASGILPSVLNAESIEWTTITID
jgi:hypothetical protein